MKRIVSVWLPLWPIERLRRAQPALVPDDAPLALVETGVHGIHITAVTPQAAAKGVRIGQALADARAVFPRLMTQPADARRDRSALLRLARWCGRYGPNRNIDGEDGIWLQLLSADAADMKVPVANADHVLHPDPRSPPEGKFPADPNANKIHPRWASHPRNVRILPKSRDFH